MTDKNTEFDRRVFMAGAVGAAATLGALGAPTRQPTADCPPKAAAEPLPRRPLSPNFQQPARLYRLEADVHDCEVTGKVPTDLNGAFYRVGPDAQYPMNPRNIPFDGEGHVSMFRIKDGRVHYRSRFVRNDRFLAQEKAGRILFPMYRNPAMDDPSVKGLSRSTANTHIINHRNYLLALKEDSPPSASEPADARDRRADLHVRQPAAEPNVHGASEARLADGQHGRVRLRVRGARQRHRDDVRVHAAGQARLDSEGAKCRTSACSTTSPSPRTTSSST